MKYYKENNTSGIYKILNITNDKCYVGSAININTRWKSHSRELRGSRHHSIHLQRAWNKYGEKNFLFEVIEYVDDKGKLIECEQFWLDKLKASNRKYGYNVLPTAGSMLGHKMSEESKRKMSEVRKGTKASEELKLKLSKMRTGSKHPRFGKIVSNTQRKKVSESNKEYYQNNVHPMLGKKHTDKTKNKMKENHADFKGEKGTFYGKSHTEDSKRKIGDARIGKYIGENHPLYGKNHKESSKQKMSEARKGIYFGENHPNSKVTELVVKEIRRLYEEENIKIVDLTKIFNFKRSMIDKIVKYETWKYL